MSVTASLDESPVAVEPGGEATLSVLVLNSGDTVEEVSFEVVGPCAGWTTAEPAAVSLYPGASASATLTLRPPRTSGLAPGDTPLGVRAVPTSEPDRAVVHERTVTLLPFTEVTSELVPPTSHGAWRGRHKVAVDNRGNTPLTVALTSREGSERARLAFTPAELEIPPGQAKFARLRLRPAKRIWRGTPATHPFQALVAPQPAEEGAEPAPPVALDGVYEQAAILPRWLPRAVIAAFLLAGLLVGLWYGLLKPTVKSAARQAITPEAVESAISDGKKGGDTSGKGGAADDPASSGGSSGGGSGGAGGGPSAAPAGSGGSGTPTSARVTVKDSVGGSATTKSALTVGDGQTFQLTDIVVQNPQGDAGTVVISSQDGQVLDLALENFRDSDYHFVTPIEVKSGGQITISVTCREVGKPVKAPAPAQCSESLFLGGTMRSGGDSA